MVDPDDRQRVGAYAIDREAVRPEEGVVAATLRFKIVVFGAREFASVTDRTSFFMLPIPPGHPTFTVTLPAAAAGPATKALSSKAVATEAANAARVEERITRSPLSPPAPSSGHSRSHRGR